MNILSFKSLLHKPSDSKLEKRYLLAAILLIIIGIARISVTYPIFNQTYDEPAHIAAGMEYLDHGTFRYETQHPPLARIMTAIAPISPGSDCQKNKKYYLMRLIKQKRKIIYLMLKVIKHTKECWFQETKY